MGFLGSTEVGDPAIGSAFKSFPTKPIDPLAISCVFPSRVLSDLGKECVSRTGQEKMEKVSVHSPQTNQRKTQSTEFYQGSRGTQGCLLRKEPPLHILAISYHFQGEQYYIGERMLGLCYQEPWV